jgi:hypothetical protein
MGHSYEGKGGGEAGRELRPHRVTDCETGERESAQPAFRHVGRTENSNFWRSWCSPSDSSVTWSTACSSSHSRSSAVTSCSTSNSNSRCRENRRGREQALRKLLRGSLVSSVLTSVLLVWFRGLENPRRGDCTRGLLVPEMQALIRAAMVATLLAITVRSASTRALVVPGSAAVPVAVEIAARSWQRRALEGRQVSGAAGCGAKLVD